VSCAPSGDEGPISYIEIKKTRNTQSETKGDNKKTNEQKKMKKINKHKQTNKNPKAELALPARRHDHSQGHCYGLVPSL
jgi:hypothetical protein